ncbi:hypothetical protein ACPWR0_13570 [Pandoraea pneumonica]|uniref:hypothetical protein n=1 Tax=Pandoraea pneumonica TaxID=2508299 RepID=UPI003CF3F833
MSTSLHIIRRTAGVLLTATLAGTSMLAAAQAVSICAAPPVMTTTLRGTYQLEGEGPLPIELVLASRDGASSRVFQVTGIVSEGEHRFGVSGMAYCMGDAGDVGRGKLSTLAFDITMSGGFHDTPVDDELRRAWPAGKAPKRASSVGTSLVHAEVALASMQGWAEAMRTIVLTGQRVMGPRHVSAKVSFAAAGEAGHGQ